MSYSLKKLGTIVLLNAILVLFFVWTSYAIAYDFNRYPNELVSVNWNFFGFADIYHSGALANGSFVATGAHTQWLDFPFWLFFISTAINMTYIVKLLKEQEPKKKQQPPQ